MASVLPPASRIRWATVAISGVRPDWLVAITKYPE
jgi:hypothetical protein